LLHDPSGHGGCGSKDSASRRYRRRSPAGLRGLFVQETGLPTNSITISCAATWSRCPARPHRHLPIALITRECLGDSGCIGKYRQGKSSLELVTRKQLARTSMTFPPFERYLWANARDPEFFLNIAKEEQASGFSNGGERSLRRTGKFSEGERTERALWPSSWPAIRTWSRHTSTAGAMVRGARDTNGSPVVIGSAIVSTLEV